jgi:hypothetical protein
MDTTILYIIFGVMLIVGLVGQYILNPYRKASTLDISDMDKDELEEILSWSLETLSEEYGVEVPKYKVGKLNDPKYGRGIPPKEGYVDGAIYVCDLDLIVINQDYPKFGRTLNDLLETICHEFQHYMDKLSMGDWKKWSKTYEENVDYYEMKAIQFGESKSKELLKRIVNIQNQ